MKLKKSLLPDLSADFTKFNSILQIFYSSLISASLKYMYKEYFSLQIIPFLTLGNSTSLNKLDSSSVCVITIYVTIDIPLKFFLPKFPHH